MTQTITRPSLWALHAGHPLPDLDMIGTYYGVPLSDIGEEGDVIALGHVGRHRMIAALRRHARENWAADLFFDAPITLDEAEKCISYLWMVNTSPSNERWYLERAEASAQGAFPVTYFSA